MIQAKELESIPGIPDEQFRLVKDEVLSRRGLTGSSIVYGYSRDVSASIWKTMSGVWAHMRRLNGWVDLPVPQIIEEQGGEDFYCPNCGWHDIALSKYANLKCEQCGRDMFIDF